MLHVRSFHIMQTSQISSSTFYGKKNQKHSVESTLIDFLFGVPYSHIFLTLICLSYLFWDSEHKPICSYCKKMKQK